jgi:hypothetical protein
MTATRSVPAMIPVRFAFASEGAQTSGGRANCSQNDALNASEADDGNEPMELPELQ